MKVFILEDNPERVKFFRQELDDDNELTIVDDIRIGKMFLESESYGIMFLDHDFLQCDITTTLMDQKTKNKSGFHFYPFHIYRFWMDYSREGLSDKFSLMPKIDEIEIVEAELLRSGCWKVACLIRIKCIPVSLP